MATLSPLPVWQMLDANAAPLAGGRLYGYEAGTSTPKALYTDASGSTPVESVLFDSAGRGQVWLGSGAYKLVLKNASGAEVWTVDNVNDASSTAFIATADTVADLVALDAGSALAVNVLGYHVAGDGGGGLFRWDALNVANFDGGTVFRPDTLPAAGRWIRVDRGTANVRHFGATGNTAARDTTGFAFAKDYASDNGLTVDISAGEYELLTSPDFGSVQINIEPGAMIKWDGFRPFFTLSAPLALSEVFDCSTASAPYLRGVDTISPEWFTGTDTVKIATAQAASASLAESEGCKTVALAPRAYTVTAIALTADTVINGAASGKTTVITNGNNPVSSATGGTLTDVTMLDLWTGTTAAAVHITGGSAKFERVHLKNYGGNGFQAVGGILDVKDCSATQCNGAGLIATGAAALVDGFRAVDCRVAGVILDEGSDGSSLTNIRTDGCGSIGGATNRGIYVYKSDRATITSSVSEGDIVGGMLITESSGANVTGYTVIGGASATDVGIAVTSSPTAIISASLSGCGAVVTTSTGCDIQLSVTDSASPYVDGGGNTGTRVSVNGVTVAGGVTDADYAAVKAREGRLTSIVGKSPCFAGKSASALTILDPGEVYTIESYPHILPVGKKIRLTAAHAFMQKLNVVDNANLKYRVSIRYVGTVENGDFHPDNVSTIYAPLTEIGIFEINNGSYFTRETAGPFFSNPGPNPLVVWISLELYNSGESGQTSQVQDLSWTVMMTEETI